MKPVTEDLRRTLLDASLELISQQGLGAFSMREVARRAGVSHQAPYHHFHDREAILAELVAEGFQRLRADMVAALAHIADPIDRLGAIGRAYVGFALAHPPHFKLMFRSELVQTEKHGEAQSCAASAFALLVSAADEVARAKFGQADQTLVIAAWSLAHGLATLALEGKLEHPCGVAQEAQSAVAEAVMAQFGALVRAR